MTFNQKLAVGSKSNGLLKTSLQYSSQNAKTFPNMSGHELFQGHQSLHQIHSNSMIT